ncbi:MAG: hypothetical protein WBA16_04040 [Nonlabens sp.]
MSKLFKIFKYAAVFVGIVFLAALLFKWYFDQPVPTGDKGSAARTTAVKMLDAINADQLKNVDSIHFKFNNRNYRWNYRSNEVVINYDSNQIFLNTKSPELNTALVENSLISGDESVELINDAIARFNNDSFWLLAPFKVNDPGTQLELVTPNKLKVTYTSGGSTPGDIYLWQLDDRFLPISLQMWVEILPLEGVKAQWSGWQATPAGILMPTSRTIYGIELPLENVQVFGTKVQ